MPQRDQNMFDFRDFTEISATPRGERRGATATPACAHARWRGKQASLRFLFQ
jgi:hypothetical protein